MAVNGIALGAVAAGSVFAYAAIKGKSITASFQAIMQGKSPGTVPQSTPITDITAALNDAAAAGAAAGAAVGTNIPSLGTTLPPEATMVKYFGPKGDSSHEQWVPFAGKTVQVNKALAANVIVLGTKLANAGYSGYIRTVGGFRTSVGASGSPIPYSMHQFGAAIDINEDGGSNGNWHTMTLPAGMVSIFASMNWFCGENWPGASRDGGHFQFTGG